jgi:hypothetical protein
MLCKITLNDCVPAYDMTKWEYLVVNPITGYMKGSDYGGTVIGFMMNDKRVLFKTIMKRGDEKIDPNCDIYLKWMSIGQYQLLNDLGDEGWELIKIRDRSTYFFKRPL